MQNEANQAAEAARSAEAAAGEAITPEMIAAGVERLRELLSAETSSTYVVEEVVRAVLAGA